MASKQIGNHTFNVTSLPPRKAYLTALKVAACFGPLIASVVEDAGAEGLDKLAKDTDGEAGNEKIVGAVLRSIGNVPADKLESLVEDLIEVTSVEGSPGVGGPLRARFDAVFHDGLDDFFAWVAFAVVTNFGAFFRKAAQAAAEKARAAKLAKAQLAADPGAPEGGVAGVATGDGEGRVAP